jgi:hypothetical protein
MRLYGAIQKVEPLDDGTVRVHGIATTEAIDDQGEIVRASAMRAALPEYMRFPAIREMHQLSAAGTALEADVGDDNVTRIVAHVVDPVAVSKVKAQVYRGFSIGGRVTQREAGNPKTITGLQLSEISLVDRPANPEATFDCWKATAMPEKTAAAFNPPIQVWSCGDTAHQHFNKSDAIKCIEKRAAEPVAEAAAIEKQAEAGAATEQAAVDAELAAVETGELVIAPATTETTETTKADATPSKRQRQPVDKTSLNAIAKSLYDVGDIAMMIGMMRQLAERLDFEAAIEGDGSSAPGTARQLCADLCQFLRDLVAEETSEVLDGTEIDPGAIPMESVAMSAIADCIRSTIADSVSAEALVTTLEKIGARHNATDKAQLDTAGYAIQRAMGTGSAKRAEMASMVTAHKAVLDAGATNLGADGREMLTNSNPVKGNPTQNSTVDTARNARESVPNATGASPAKPVPGEAMKASDPIAFIDGLVKGGAGHVALCMAAHDLLHAVSDGTTCKEGGQKPARHNATDWAQMHKAHGHLMLVDGVECAANAVPEGEPTTAGESEGEGTSATAGGAGTDKGEPGSDKTKAATGDDLLKTAAPEDEALAKAVDARFAGFSTALDTVVATLGKMGQRIEQIALTPMPPVAIARLGAAAGTGTATDEAGLTADQVTKALSEMSSEDRALVTIKASYRNPMKVSGFTDGPGPWRPTK